MCVCCSPPCCHPSAVHCAATRARDGELALLRVVRRPPCCAAATSTLGAPSEPSAEDELCPRTPHHALHIRVDLTIESRYCTVSYHPMLVTRYDRCKLCVTIDLQYCSKTTINAKLFRPSRRPRTVHSAIISDSDQASCIHNQPTHHSKFNIIVCFQCLFYMWDRPATHHPCLSSRIIAFLRTHFSSPDLARRPPSRLPRPPLNSPA